MEARGDSGLPGLPAPSPQSEAVAHELEELTLQPSNNLPPLNERKNVLQLRLQQRRTREQLVDQGIMPPLKSPAAFHEQIRSLERARTENFLKHKIRSRPQRSELVRMHILQETLAEPSLQATQLKLKRARLADDLNEKLAQRPGPLELVEKNILPVDSTLKDAIVEGQMQYPKTLEAFDEDSWDALSPDQPASQDSQSSAASPGDTRPPETPSPLPITSITLQPSPSVPQAVPDFLKPFPSSEKQLPTPPPAVAIPQPISPAAPTKPAPMLVKQSQPKMPGDKSRSKKSKEAKPRVKKLKYHQYIPPDQKQEPSEEPMDSAYARLLQQQQLFLQLQIISQQQQQHYNYQAILPAPLKPVVEGQPLNSTNSLPTSIVVSLPAAAPAAPTAAPAKPNNTASSRKVGMLPANLEEMKVAELKMELKLRGLPVSGTKTDLIERLKPYQDSPAAPVHASTTPHQLSTNTTTTSTTPMEVSISLASLSPSQQPPVVENMTASPPVSPMPTDPTKEDAGRVLESHREALMAMLNGPRVPEERDRQLHEKERQIKELLRKLEHEQRLVEELKMQLEVEKRSGISSTNQAMVPSPPPPPPTLPLTFCESSPRSPVFAVSPVKTEHRAPTNCTMGVQGSPQMVKLEEAHAAQVNSAAAPLLPQFLISHAGMPQVLTHPQTTIITTQHAGTPIVLPVSLPNNTGTIQLPTVTGVKLQPVLHAAVSPQGPGLIQAPVPQLRPGKPESPSAQQLSSHNHLVQTLPVCTPAGFQHRLTENQVGPEGHQCFLSSSPDNRLSPRASPGHTVSNGPLNKSPSHPQPTFILHPTTFTSIPKSKEPPRYEDAVKQSRSMQNAALAQVPTATSQQMDDLFDILIESGEITPFSPHEPSTPKLMPVTASVTTLPINTALSRPPAHVQLAPPPVLGVDTLPSLASLATDNQLEALLDGALEAEPRLLEDLHAQLLADSQHSAHSPMDTTDLGFSETGGLGPSSSSSSFSLQEAGLDSMEWLDLTMPGTMGTLNPLGMATDFLDTHDLQMPWD
ncbi:myocardin-related transcription factor B isoform X1 [Clupea harengus]|uniref:Myocardin-related transcription factor B isoform X1 n=1 Tax=Clupea harengus TaxID=7950 RepID=A0A6P8F040_CLUHA|nr:myocardin-related transcription factor B isoform X1 [Clupea harengus]XP_012694386.2 myocardin-related transcription factor B isoform X1 [Clupea harengus]XP_031416502.1 myocardin-related transcription factor B isoform X1 [Clupea harengus]XP_031416503.1 myocardin-related transcription factor B isoform X1 [Clupea harengus]